MRKVKKKGGYRPGSGRKPLPPEDRRSERVVVLLTPSELAKLEEAAGDEPTGTYAHRVIARHLARRKK